MKDSKKAIEEIQEAVDHARDAADLATIQVPVVVLELLLKEAKRPRCFCNDKIARWKREQKEKVSP